MTNQEYIKEIRSTEKEKYIQGIKKDIQRHKVKLDRCIESQDVAAAEDISGAIQVLEVLLRLESEAKQ